MAASIGKYQILERIGRGGMGTVYKGHDPILDRMVALKVISSDGDVPEELKARFYREAQACAKLNHPNIVVVHDLGEDASQLFIVMEFLEGHELKALIERQTLTLEEKLALMIQVCEGLHFAHQKGIIHRDIKPGNIFVLRNGQVKILDFGIARIAAGTDPGLTRTGFIMGTLRYMSPEQARGRVDQRSDVFSVGAVFYELLAGQPAFDSPDPMQILEKIRAEQPPSLTELNPTIPPELAGIIERALRKDPAQRFPDLRQMRTQLEAVRRGLSDEDDRLDGQVRGQLERLQALQAQLASLFGEASEEETVPLATGTLSREDLRALSRELAGRIEKVGARVRQAQALEPAVTRGLALLAAGNAAGATGELELVVREMPEHERAQAALHRARHAVPSAPSRTAPRPPAPTRGTPPPAPAGRVAAPGPARTRPDSRLAPPLVSVTTGPPVRVRTGQGRLALAGVAGVLFLGVGGYAVFGPARPASPPAPVVSPAPPVTPPAPATRSERGIAEELRAKTRGARESAAKGEAERLAAGLWAPAAAKEREAEAAFGRQEYAAAQAAYRDAERAYERAGAQAQRAVVLVAREFEARRVQERAVEARQAAEAADAARLAPPLWARATRAERDAESALRGQDFERAQALWRDSEQAYREAATEAGRKAPGPGPRPVGGDPQGEIRTVLDTYRQAIEARDARLLRKVRPGLGPAEVRRLAQTQSHKLDLAIDRVDVNGDEAEAKGRRTDVVVSRDGRTFRNEAAVVFKLRRAGAGWVIDAVN